MGVVWSPASDPVGSKEVKYVPPGREVWKESGEFLYVIPEHKHQYLLRNNTILATYYRLFII